ncbi:hypothetical protein EYF80_045913 [Liparis tanakae]|uniref:Uncharacterized protein n=1 Tax=Liparis tanakae TaxID=230148 RepID=A0A4Z2FSB0_9TELE|nr:hypothetical protein EYF80_045913 [Liparis tanakae]
MHSPAATVPSEAGARFAQTEDVVHSESCNTEFPASIPELVLALIDAHLGAFAHDDDGVRAALADGPLARIQLNR